MNHFSKEIDSSEKNTKKASVIIEEMLLDMYFLVVKRIKGIGTSINEFWETSAKNFSYIYRIEKEILDKEREEYESDRLQNRSTSSSGKMITPKHKDSEKNINAYNSFMTTKE